MRVLLVTHGYPPEIAAGTERIVERLARDLLGRGHEVSVLTGSFEPRPRVEIAERIQDGVRVLTLRRSDLYFDRWEKTYSPEASEAFARALADLRPDVVHVHHFIRLSRDLVHRATQARIPAVLTLHDLTTTCLIGFRAPGDGTSYCDLLPRFEDCVPCAGTVSPSVPLAGAEEFRLLREDFANELRLARIRCAVSTAQAEKLARYHGLPRESFEITPPALSVDLPHGKPASEPPPLRAATWGMQSARKGTGVVLEALRLVPPGSVELDVFGGFEDPAFERRSRGEARGLPVRLHGAFRGEEIAEHPIHVAIFPSLLFETFGLVLEEARALGHPMICSDQGAYRERADPTTLLFPPGDARALAAHLKRLALDPGELAARRGGVRGALRFSAYVDRMEAIYRRAADLGPAAISDDRFDEKAHPDKSEFARREEEFRRRLSGTQKETSARTPNP